MEKVTHNICTRASRKASQSTVHKSAITDHVVDNNHVIDWEGAQIVGRECNKYKRWIKEAISIRKAGCTMNRDEGQYHLSHMFDDLLLEKKSIRRLETKKQSRKAVNPPRLKPSRSSLQQ